MWEWALGPLFFMTILENSPPFGGGERSDPLKKITELVAELAAPAVEEAGCSLWDVEYVREGGTWYLRIYIDKPGGVDILDCETVSRACWTRPTPSRGATPLRSPPPGRSGR